MYHAYQNSDAEPGSAPSEHILETTIEKSARMVARSAELCADSREMVHRARAQLHRSLVALRQDYYPCSYAELVRQT